MIFCSFPYFLYPFFTLHSLLFPVIHRSPHQTLRIDSQANALPLFPQENAALSDAKVILANVGYHAMQSETAPEEPLAWKAVYALMYYCRPCKLGLPALLTGYLQ